MLTFFLVEIAISVAEVVESRNTAMVLLDSSFVTFVGLSVVKGGRSVVVVWVIVSAVGVMKGLRY